LQNEIPTSLCGYFWKLVFSVLQLTAALAGLIFFFVLIGFLILWYPFSISDYKLIHPVLEVLVAFITGLGASAFVMYTVYMTKRKISDDNTPDGVIMTYFKAKKAKVCPIIEIVD
jgi:apolipoprotein N-acyltransferase